MISRARWDAAVKVQYQLATELDAQNALAPQNTPEFLAVELALEEGVRELDDARKELYDAGLDVSREEWRSAYGIHRAAMTRWNRRLVLDTAVVTVQNQQKDTALLYERIARERLFEVLGG